MDRKYKPTRPRAVTRIDFEYSGRDGPPAPKNITHVQVTSNTCSGGVHEGAFLECLDLAQVEFPTDGNAIETIGDAAFGGCELLKNPKLPVTLKRIGNSSFSGCTEIRQMELPSILEDIGPSALSKCKFRNLRLPPKMTRLRRQTLYNCNHMVSLEIPKTGLTQIDESALEGCFRLRNLAIPSTVDEIGDNIFQYCIDLEKVFPDHSDLMRVLKTRFDRLPIHSLCYYHPYHDHHQSTASTTSSTTTTVKKLHKLLRRETSSRFQCRRDIFGMTPFHILTLSTKHDIQLYKALIQFHPEDLITKDIWGDYPIYYACSTYAPIEILELLFAHYSVKHPDLKLDWTKMVYNLTLGNAPVETIQYVIEAHHDCYPDQRLDWPKMIMNSLGSPVETLKYLVRASIDKRLEALGYDQWRDVVLQETEKIPIEEDWEERDKQIDRILAAVKKYELKEALSLLELTVWKGKIDEESSSSSEGRSQNHSKPATKKARVDHSELRKQCRFHCPVDVIISNVLPFLEEEPKQQPRPEDTCTVM